LADQADRESGDWQAKQEAVSKRDGQRLRRVEKLLFEGKLATAADYFRAATIFHHNFGKQNFEKAHELAEQALSMEPQNYDLIWLEAVSRDRMLVAQGKKQKFGSQFEYSEISPGKFRYQMADFDRRTSDATRAKHEIPKLRKLKSMEGHIVEV